MSYFGLVGFSGAGKSTVAEYLRDHYNACMLVISDQFATMLDRLGLPPTQKNKEIVARTIRDLYGEQVIDQAVLRQAGAAQGDLPRRLFVIDGIRLSDGLQLYRERPGFWLIAIVATPEVRLERLNKRAGKPDQSYASLDDLLAHDQMPNERGIARLISNADRLIENNGSIAELEAKIDRLMATLGHTRHTTGT